LGCETEKKRGPFPPEKEVSNVTGKEEGAVYGETSDVEVLWRVLEILRKKREKRLSCREGEAFFLHERKPAEV